MAQFLRTDNQTKRIVKIEFRKEPDDYFDLSYLGEYSNEPADNCIDREARGDRCSNREYRYFIPATTGEETGNPNSPEQDYERMEDYNRGGWCMCFCQAVAFVSINGVAQRLLSGGIGGVESDSDESYFEELAEDELDELHSILDDIGFTTQQIDEAMENVIYA